MNVGVFLCLEPYTSLENNLRLAHEYGFNYADITDTHSGGSMFASAGLSASVSLDDNPFEIRRTFERNGMKIMTLSAHALLLEPSSPANFATAEIMKAIKFAAGAGIEYVPLGNDILRLHAVYFRDNHDRVNNFDIGITWRFNIYKR